MDDEQKQPQQAEAAKANSEKRRLKQRRVKIRLEFAEKLFYEKVLNDWRENITDRNHAFVIRKALGNLKLFPLNVSGFSDLRKIRGIGVDIATRLDAAWRLACDVYFNSESPSLEQVKSLGKGESLQFLEQSTAAGANMGGQRRVPFLPKKKRAIADEGKEDKDKRKKGGATAQSQHSSSQGAAGHSSQLAEPAKEREQGGASPAWQPPSSSSSLSDGVLKPATIVTNHATQSTSAPMTAKNCDEPLSKGMQMISHSPGDSFQSQVLLVADNRESIAAVRGKRKGKGVTEHLLGMEVNLDSRILSVGDFLWLLQWTDRMGKQYEMVLDWVVERKTWDDLKRSIRETRYLEQKARLGNCGVRNVVLVVEGGLNGDRSLEQAMTSTSVDNRFLVHRTLNSQGTAKFLHHLTKRLEKRCREEKGRNVFCSFFRCKYGQ